MRNDLNLICLAVKIILQQILDKSLLRSNSCDFLPLIALNLNLAILHRATNATSLLHSLGHFSFSGKPMPTKFLTTVTVLPPLPALTRRISTRPRCFFAGFVGSTFAGRCSGPGGRPALDRPPKGAWTKAGPPSVEMRLDAGDLMSTSSRFGTLLCFSGPPKPNHHIFVGFVEVETEILNFFCNPRHVSNTPRHHNVVR